MKILINGINANLRFSSAHLIPTHKSCGFIHGHSYFVDVEIEGERAGEFQFVTRTLITSAGFDGGSISLGDFTAEDGGALTKASGIMEGNAADYQGQYYLYTEDGNVKVQYVVAGAVPEPATATLSLLGLASLMLRRRRA